FKVDGTPVACVWWDMTEAYEFDMLAATEVVRTIVEEQASVFGSLPFFKYLFLYTISPTGGGGGLEHLNSTSIGLSARGLRASPESLAGITAHEFFHTWNVKRIRPIALGPFEYEQQNYTGNLWVSEGWTSYYGDLSMLRSGLLSRENYLRNMARTIQSELSKPRRKEHSVYWASRNVWHRLPDEA
ncbi:MAG: M61 family peptidase, partial [Anaerolineae bacterium]|nr:M61 family peptidase [Anaerolineae bacterium]